MKLKAVLDSNGRNVHDQITVDSLDSTAAVNFISKHENDYLLNSYDKRGLGHKNSEWEGFRGFISKPPQWIFAALVFGKAIDRRDVDSSLTIELTSEQYKEYTYMCNSRKARCLKDIAGDLVNDYRMWFVHVERPLWNAGLADSSCYSYISCPVSIMYPNAHHNAKPAVTSEADDDAAWRQEIAMQAGMMGGCEAYTETMGY
jgi:hypothetical protein